MRATRLRSFASVLAVTAAATMMPAQTTNTGLCPQGGGPDYERSVSLRELVPNLLCDQKAIWTFPAKLGEGHVLVPTIAVVGVTGALFMADPSEARYFHQSTSFSGFNTALASTATETGVVLAPVSLYAIGHLRKDTKMERTGLLAGEALLDTEVVATVFKDLDRRRRPIAMSKNQNYWDSWFDASGPDWDSKGGFPSGHTIGAFAVATVIAHRYREHRWVPYVAYGLAGAVGFSRLTLSQHFASDVFIGGALGYSIARFNVLRQ